MQKFNPTQTNTHDLYNTALHDRDRKPIICYGSAGTGKTFMAIKAALKQLDDGSIDKIICTRPNVSFADKSGFLPGTEREKMEPWIRPILQNMLKLGRNEAQIKYLEHSKQLQFYPLETIQGMTFDNAFIMVDEVQNMCIEQLKVFLTRTGAWSRTALCGDIAQISPKFSNSGLAELIRIVEYFNMPVHTLEMTVDDIMRSQQCKDWIIAFAKWDAIGEPDNY